MNEFTIDVLKDYVSDETIAGIIEDEIRRTVRGFYATDTERKISNTMYSVVFSLVDAVFKENNRNFRSELTKRIEDVIAELPHYYVFRRKDKYDQNNSVAQDILEEESNNARPLIRECVLEAIKNYDINKLTEDEIMDMMYSVIRDKLFGSEKTQEEEHTT